MFGNSCVKKSLHVCLSVHLREMCLEIRKETRVNQHMNGIVLKMSKKRQRFQHQPDGNQIKLFSSTSLCFPFCASSVLHCSLTSCIKKQNFHCERLQREIFMLEISRYFSSSVSKLRREFFHFAFLILLWNTFAFLSHQNRFFTEIINEWVVAVPQTLATNEQKAIKNLETI